MTENAAVRASELVSAADDAVPLGALDRPLVEVSGVHKHWPRRPAPVLDGVDLIIGAGRLVGLTGRNGAGKTTLLRIIAAIIAPDAGQVSVDGLDPRRHRRQYHQRIGFLSAGQSGLFARLTVRQHLEYWGRLALMGADARSAAIARVTSAFDIDELLSQRVDRLSQGQRQRIRLVLTFLHEPRVVLLDEPRNSLDSEATALLVAEIAHFTAAGGSVVWCAPSGEDIAGRVDELYSLGEGKLVQQ